MSKTSENICDVCGKTFVRKQGLKRLSETRLILVCFYLVMLPKLYNAMGKNNLFLKFRKYITIITCTTYTL